MTTLSQFSGGGRHIASIVNAHSAGGTSQINLSVIVGAKGYASSSVAVNALQTMLNITGKGSLNFVAAYSGNTDARTIRIKVTVDSVVIFDATSASVTTASSGIIAIGSGMSGASAVSGSQFVPQPVRFYSSCLVQIASNVATDGTNITTLINYETDS
jgi:hypothetical protein